ncbi:uncharacterized protein CIMG_13162 [Coccidioides immitis RS]|uniref:Uncharacterized protein n=1 Tax=Coccidioides immitis (strain RS) TaxID=246410 RepID=A0A0E1RX39_COCIM|nr:uncharacterized protein CIMG_13162 [Coccidioides immitis RS]EAS30053.2 hypothetical protein CIMG_13162 [Coccidioides immitis RS]
MVKSEEPGLIIGNYSLLQLLALPQSSSSQHSIQDIARSSPTASSPQDLLKGLQSPRSSRDVPMSGMSMPHSCNMLGASIHSEAGYDGMPCQSSKDGNGQVAALMRNSGKLHEQEIFIFSN